MKAAARLRAFTLVELLVTVGIIGILLTLGFPAFRNAIDNTRATKCQSNMRQVWHAYMGYLNDNGGEAPRENYSSFPIWIYDVMPYAMGDSFYSQYYQPNKPLPLLTCPASKLKLTDYFKSHHALNINLLSYYSSSQNGYRVTRPLSSITHPSQVLFSMDIYGGRRQAGPGNMPAPGSADWKEMFRHSQSANVVYLDGHAGQLKEIPATSTAPWIDQ